MRLFEISSEFDELFNKLDDIESMDLDEQEKDEMRQAWFDTLDGMEIEFEQKAENTAQYIKILKSESEAIDAEVKKLQIRSKVKNNHAERLKKYIIDCMEKMHKDKVESAKVKIKLRNNQPSLKIKNEDAFIAYLQKSGKGDLLKYKKPEIRKAEVKKLLKQGETFDGVRLEPSRSIIIS